MAGHPEVDIIISEWMGYCLLFECMLPSVLVARDRWAKKGLVYPDHAKMLISAWADQEYYDDRVTYWGDVYGILHPFLLPPFPPLPPFLSSSLLPFLFFTPLPSTLSHVC